MTNAEKYLKPDMRIAMWKDYNQTGQKCKSIWQWLDQEAKPTLTEDERVLLRNINTNNYDKVGRKISGALYLGIANKTEIDSTFEDFFQDSDLFKFIKERRRIFY